MYLSFLRTHTNLQLFYHEFAHIKDPSIPLSPKLDKLYNPDVVRNSKEYFSKVYYFHPREIVANTSKILNGLSTKTPGSQSCQPKIINEFLKYANVDIFVKYS